MDGDGGWRCEDEEVERANRRSWADGVGEWVCNSRSKALVSTAGERLMRRSNSPSITPPKFLPPLALDPSPTIIVAGLARGRGAPISATKTSSNSSSANNFPSTVPSFENLLKTSSYFFPVDLPLGRYALGTRGIDS